VRALPLLGDTKSGPSAGAVDLRRVQVGHSPADTEDPMLRRTLLTTGVLAGVLFAMAAPSFGGSGGGVSGGAVVLTDDDGGVPMFQVPAMTVGTPIDRCISVTNSGTGPVAAHLFAHAKGRLRSSMQVEVTRGSLTPGTAFPSCTGFVPDPTVDRGLGTGVVYQGTLAALTKHRSSVATDPGVWLPGTPRTYRVTVTLTAIPSGEPLSTRASFVWKALVP
jgi:hypothetical protein